MSTVDEERGIPEPIARAVVRFVERVGPFFPAGSLRMGGGTILQARWGHRQSTDADLFDVVAAERHDPMALQRAVGLLTDVQVNGICATLLTLPRRWDVRTDKPVLSMSGEHGTVAPADVVEVLRRSARDP